MQHIIHSRMNAENKYSGGVHSIYLIDAYVEPASAKWFHKTMLSLWSSFIFILHSINSKWKWLKSWFYSLLKVSLHFSPLIHTHTLYDFGIPKKSRQFYSTLFFLFIISIWGIHTNIFANGTRWIEWRWRRSRRRKKYDAVKMCMSMWKADVAFTSWVFMSFITLWLISVVNFVLSLMNGFSFERSSKRNNHVSFSWESPDSSGIFFVCDMKQSTSPRHNTHTHTHIHSS